MHLQLGERMCGLAHLPAEDLPAQPRLPLLIRLPLAQEVAVVPSPHLEALSVCTPVSPADGGALRSWASLVELRVSSSLFLSPNICGTVDIPDADALRSGRSAESF